ncbi:hypothetical protein ACU8MP_26275 (plasmid) [Rhizobium leguminosarum]
MKPGFPYSALFAGKRVLVVEDEYMLANETRKSLPLSRMYSSMTRLYFR